MLTYNNQCNNDVSICNKHGNNNVSTYNKHGNNDVLQKNTKTTTYYITVSMSIMICSSDFTAQIKEVCYFLSLRLLTDLTVTESMLIRIQAEHTRAALIVRNIFFIYFFQLLLTQQNSYINQSGRTLNKRLICEVHPL